MLRDISPDLQQAPWAIEGNAGLGIPKDAVLLVGVSGLVRTILPRPRCWARSS